ncbi:MAG: tRNA (adenosine(37)-N6)-dimethylallyltransferase MiaA [Bacilli bacterium]|nr:tRNA (adenosine(37)-N6)-dimethylallyltransferase MiaA [Bacilli bacterium]
MILVVVGPTGVGKTKMSVELAKHYNAEIINADSMQVYKDLDIGTAKVTDSEKEGIPHHLFDICDVKDLYTVYDYQKDGRAMIEKLTNENKNIVIVGGTGLYIKALLYDYKFKNEEELDDYSYLTNEEIMSKIKKYDEECDIHINNRKRLVRYLNKLEQDLVLEKQGNNKLYDFKMIGLTTDRDTLYEKINNRVDKMVKDGLVEEVKSFYDKGIRSKAIMTGIGYKELYKYFDNEISLDEALDLIKKNSRRYAKRQYTFFKNQFSDIKWYETNYDDFNKTVSEVISDIDSVK